MDKLHNLDPNRYPEPSDLTLHNLYELYFPPRDAEMYNDFADWPEWIDPM